MTAVRFCPTCDGPFHPATHPDQECCSRTCASSLRLKRSLGCGTCAFGDGLCDDHEVPPVCVCTQPHPDGIGQCRVCLRPYKTTVPGFDACRDAGVAHLTSEPAGV